MAYHASDHPRAPKGTPQGGQFTQKAGVGGDDDLNPGFGDNMANVKDLEQQVIPYQLPYGWDNAEVDNGSVLQEFAYLISQANRIPEKEATQWVENHPENVYQYLALREARLCYDIDQIDPDVLVRIGTNLQADIEDEAFVVETFDDVEARASFLLYEELNDALSKGSGERVLPDPYQADLRGWFIFEDSCNDNALRYASVTPIFTTKDGAKRIAEVGYEQAYAESELPNYLARV